MSATQTGTINLAIIALVSKSDYRIGCELYGDGAFREECQNAEQERGWLAASNEDAAAETGFWLKSRPHRYVDEEMDDRYERM